MNVSSFKFLKSQGLFPPDHLNSSFVLYSLELDHVFKGFGFFFLVEKYLILLPLETYYKFMNKNLFSTYVF